MIALERIEGTGCLKSETATANATQGYAGDFDASMLAGYLQHLPKGANKVQQMICDDMRIAMRKSDADQAKALFRTLQHFMKDHPEAARGAA
ncbi:hypothetical protein [Tropicimonas sp.]|uniref:hypothetical protein n=1 Tax=Tropicimonas sp. TaxID=2067044 RepID=UPI003A8C4461